MRSTSTVSLGSDAQFSPFKIYNVFKDVYIHDYQLNHYCCNDLWVRSYLY